MEEIKKQIEELKKQLQEIKDKIFELNLVDHWTMEDSNYSNELGNKLSDVQRKIRELEEKLNANI